MVEFPPLPRDKDALVDLANLIVATVPAESAAYPKGQSFAGRVIGNQYFVGLNLAGADFSGAVLRAVSFEGTNLSGASFVGATLENCYLSDTVLDDTNFDSSTINDGRWKDSNGKRTSIRNATATGVSFQKSQFDLAELDTSRFRGCTFTNMCFEAVSLIRAEFADCEFVESHVDSGNRLIEGITDLAGTRSYNHDVGFPVRNFGPVQLDELLSILDRFPVGARFERTKFSGTKLAGHFTQVAFSDSVFRVAELRGCFQSTTWENSLLSEVSVDWNSDFSISNFSGAHLVTVDMGGVRLYGADFSDAIVVDLVLDDAVINNSETLIGGRVELFPPTRLPSTGFSPCNFTVENDKGSSDVFLKPMSLAAKLMEEIPLPVDIQASWEKRHIEARDELLVGELSIESVSSALTVLGINLIASEHACGVLKTLGESEKLISFRRSIEQGEHTFAQMLEIALRQEFLDDPVDPLILEALGLMDVEELTVAERKELIDSSRKHLGNAPYTDHGLWEALSLKLDGLAEKAEKRLRTSIIEDFQGPINSVVTEPQFEVEAEPGHLKEFTLANFLAAAWNNYRYLARIVHPDVNPSDSGGREFKAINAADKFLKTELPEYYKNADSAPKPRKPQVRKQKPTAQALPESTAPME